jgi:DNA-binding transcriptional LysR family regulator
MDKLAAMQVFTRVVAEGSFAGAGRQLGLTRSAVSKGVMELEQILGARLLDRTTRRVSPTEAGRAYYERCVDILASIEETELQISRLHDEPRGVLKVNAPMSFGALYLGEAVADFMAAHADLNIELTLSDRFIDPIEEGVDVTIRIAALQDSSLIARKFAPARLVLVASPDARRSVRASMSHVRSHDTSAALGIHDGRRVSDGADQLGALFEQWRHPESGRDCRTRHHQTSDVSHRSRHQGGAAQSRAW